MAPIEKDFNIIFNIQMNGGEERMKTITIYKADERKVIG